MVAHSVSLMGVQAAAAEQVLATEPERAREPLRAIQETARDAVEELRRLLGVLRTGSGGEAAVVVRLRWDGPEVEVRDDGGPGDGAGGERGGELGHGLIGMRARVAVYGGTISTGPEDGGGYRVRASLPRAGRQ